MLSEQRMLAKAIWMPRYAISRNGFGNNNKKIEKMIVLMVFRFLQR